MKYIKRGVCEEHELSCPEIGLQNVSNIFINLIRKDKSNETDSANN